MNTLSQRHAKFMYEKPSYYISYIKFRARFWVPETSVTMRRDALQFIILKTPEPKEVVANMDLPLKETETCKAAVAAALTPDGTWSQIVGYKEGGLCPWETHHQALLLKISVSDTICLQTPFFRDSHPFISKGIILEGKVSGISSRM